MLGLIERGTGDCYMIPVKNRQRSTLLPIVKKVVQVGSKVYSDEFRPYWTLSKEGKC